MARLKDCRLAERKAEAGEVRGDCNDGLGLVQVGVGGTISSRVF
jgi:hypothetical protein